jgi:ribosomal protein L11 methyltransferase
VTARRVEVFLGLGSNLGDRQANLRQAVKKLREHVNITGASSVYETAPVGFTEQPDFVNAVVRGRTELSPVEMLRFAKGIENAMGRTPAIPNGPRVIDIDVLLYGDTVLDSPEVTVPHPRMATRGFVLTPLAEIAPDLRHPVLRRTMRHLAREAGPTGIRRVAGPRALGVRQAASPGGGTWTELAVTVAPELVEPVTELFVKRGRAAVAIEQASEELLWPGERAGGASKRSVDVTVRAYLPAGRTGSRRRAVIEAGLSLLGLIVPMPEPAVREVRAEEWEAVLRGHFSTLHIGRRLVVQPVWQEYAAKPGEVVIKLDPGVAFGTGHHPTTRLCLEVLEDWVRPGARVLDVGTGSGVLAIAAMLLGAASVLGVDTDPLAVRMARRNARANGLQQKSRFLKGSLPLSEPTASDLVVANITVGVLTAIMPHLRASLGPSGVLVLSGVLREQVHALEASASEHGLVRAALREEGDWTATVWQVAEHH